jgi:hypothetical protein
MTSMHHRIRFILVATAFGLAGCTKNLRDSTVATSVPRPLMPNLLCMNLQDAQDLIQDQGVFFSKSEDASGQDRRQVIDSNWVVISQNFEAGAPIDEGEVVLGVLKKEELVRQNKCNRK